MRIAASPRPLWCCSLRWSRKIECRTHLRAPGPVSMALASCSRPCHICFPQEPTDAPSPKFSQQSSADSVTSHTATLDEVLQATKVFGGSGQGSQCRSPCWHCRMHVAQCCASSSWCCWRRTRPSHHKPGGCPWLLCSMLCVAIESFLRSSASDIYAQLSIAWREVSQLCWPYPLLNLLDILKPCTPSSVGSSCVFTAGYCSKALLPSCVPYLQLDPLVIDEDLLDFEVNPAYIIDFKQFERHYHLYLHRKLLIPGMQPRT